MPVNMDPSKRRRTHPAKEDKTSTTSEQSSQTKSQPHYEETESDREKALADAEWKNLWDATEVIDMDRW
jgi:hypothetical protein